MTYINPNGMDYNFDELIDRTHTDSLKYDLRKTIFGKQDVIPMWVADMDFRTPDFILEAIHKRLQHPVLGYAAQPPGLNAAIVDWMRGRHGWSVKKEWIALGPGVVPSMAVMVHAFSEPGDEIVVQQPVYFPFFRTITGNGRRLVNNPLVYSGGRYVMDLDDLKNKITPRTRMIFLCSPHNPVGRVWEKDELQALASLCLENNLLIVSDEIHSDLVMFGHKHTPTATLNDEVARHTITCLSGSKTFNMAGMNTSYVLISDGRIRSKYNRRLSDFHLNLGNVAGMVALEAAYKKGEPWLAQVIDYIEGNILYTEEYLQEHLPSVRMVRPEGTYLIWLDFSGTSVAPDKLKRFIIEQANIGLSDGELFGAEGRGFQRMNVACPRKVLRRALENLRQALNL